MWADDSRPSMYGDAGLRRSPPWRLALRWPALWRKVPVCGPGSDLWFLSGHLRRDIGLGNANVRQDAHDGRYLRFL